MRGAENTFVGPGEPTLVLLVVKHVVFRQALALVLERHAGFEAIHAGSLAEAHQVLRDLDAEPGLAVVDLELPDGEGFELIGQIREAWSLIPVLALTSGKEPERAARTREAGAYKVLTTATSSDELLERVRRLGNS